MASTTNGSRSPGGISAWVGSCWIALAATTRRKSRTALAGAPGAGSTDCTNPRSCGMSVFTDESQQTLPRTKSSASPELYERGRGQRLLCVGADADGHPAERFLAPGGRDHDLLQARGRIQTRRRIRRGSSLAERDATSAPASAAPSRIRTVRVTVLAFMASFPFVGLCMASPRSVKAAQFASL